MEGKDPMSGHRGGPGGKGNLTVLKRRRCSNVSDMSRVPATTIQSKIVIVIIAPINI